MVERLNWGILGAGNIAGKLAAAFDESDTGRLLAIGSRSQQKAERFGQQYDVERCRGSYREIIDDPEVDVIYNALPNSLHYEWTVEAARAGKHVLCEKPLTTNADEAERMIEVVRDCDVFMMEAFMYRGHPQIARMTELIREGAIGEVRVIEAHFSYNMGRDAEDIRLSNELAGGGIMDVGCYCASISRLIAGAALGSNDPAEPEAVKGVAHIGEQNRIDEWATAALKFPGGTVANLTTGCQINTDGTVRIWGSEGHIILPNPWFGGTDPASARIVLQRSDSDPETLNVPAPKGIYALEIDAVAGHLPARQASPPYMSWEDSLGNMRTLDRWRKSIGLIFDCEE